jgi:hypothetical protein
MSSFEETESALNILLAECGITQEDLNNVALIPVPSPNANRVGTKTLSGHVVQKYVDFRDYTTKEAKMAFVISRFITATSQEFVLSVIQSKWLEISNSRPYKGSPGGPVIHIGEMTDFSSTRSLRKGRTRYGEINGRFPIHAVVMELVQKFKRSKS